MDKEDKFEAELTTFIHDLFLNNEYKIWRKGLKEYEAGKWHSLIAKLHKAGAPVKRLESFGEAAFSGLVFSYIKAPDYRKSQMLMIQFTVAGSIWSSLIWHCPERN